MQTQIKPIKKTTVVEQAIESLYDLVRSQNLKPGDRLPTERDLSEALNISRSSLREAIRVMDMMGIVEVEHGHGIRLSGLNLSQSISKPLNFLIATDSNMLLELYEFRKLIEVESVKTAALKITDVEIKELKKLYSELKNYQHDRNLGIELEIKIHETIAKAGNKIMSEVIMAIHDVMKVSRESTVAAVGVSDHTIKMHGKIIEALENRDPDSAAKYMLSHVESVYSRITEE
ncbi:MAG: FadR/GntR family transcriptional regulator [Spirochaetales bacterium]|uniref:FadR/GntR family transcriptional regulator n=1 Tax=Candidatus Thalassospirochaeta sargassi TaxID=3119039 RepID=A0AAJ1MMV3_9SPIO|nr:FadR/GntR family transcriptional regulator [Spirochaetales bacterium]